MSLTYSEVTVPTSVSRALTGAQCDGCDTRLEPALPLGPGGAWASTGACNALPLVLEGGYGEYYDGSTQTMLLCWVCADRLCGEFPSMGRALRGGTYV